MNVPGFKKSTIKDVAAHAGVSTTTVSLVVSGNKSVCSMETAARVSAAVRDLDYTPSSLTRGLRRRTPSTIGACLPDPDDAQRPFGSFFLAAIWRGILQEADIVNYSLLHYPASIRNSDDHKPFLDGRVDGILINMNDGARAEQIALPGCRP